jgi:hypothetical protein
LSVFDIADNGLVAGEVTLPGFGQFQPARRTDEQLRMHLVFQPVDALDDHRWRHAELARRRGKAAGAGGGQEGLDIQQSVHSPFSIRER